MKCLYQDREWAIVYLCVRGVNFVSFYNFDDVGIVPTVWNFVFFILELKCIRIPHMKWIVVISGSLQSLDYFRNYSKSVITLIPGITIRNVSSTHPQKYQIRVSYPINTAFWLDDSGACVWQKNRTRKFYDRKARSATILVYRMDQLVNNDDVGAFTCMMRIWNRIDRR